MIVARFGEIFLKSKPVKKRFLTQLANNMRTALRKEGIKAEVIEKRLRLYIYPDTEEEKALRVLKRIFGVVSLSKATEVNPEVNEIKKESEKKIKDWKAGTFAVKAQRISKKYSFTSKDLEIEVGSLIQKETGLEVDLSNPDKVLYIEVYRDKAHVFTDKTRGPGGIPLGVAGTLRSPLKTKEDLAASWMMMKRGCMIKPIDNEINSQIKRSFEEWDLTDKKTSEPVGTVTGTKNIKELLKDYKKYQKPIYTPLIGLKEKEIEQLKKRIID
ncbi:MAG: THUMP domain-containing protein [archaeon]